ncbi:MAG: replicative DNA helicase [Bryobacterales bacterium]|nr:replicative DNA helicase [Bryobacterales bacterium]
MPANPIPVAIERNLPTSIEAERCVLGSILLDDSLFPQVAGRLQPVDFAIEKHRRIFLRMEDLHRRGVAIEDLTLVEELSRLDQLASCDGVAYIASLSEGMPRLSSIDDYVKIVKDKALLRQLIHTADNIVTRSIEGGQQIDEVLNEAESAILKVGDAQLRSELASPRQIVEGFAGGVEEFLDPGKRVAGLSTPFVKFDEMTTGLREGELIVIAARPSMGKTALALNIAWHVADDLPDKPGEPVAVFSLEMSKESLLTRLLCAIAKVDSHRFRGGYLGQDERSRLRLALDRLVASKLFIDDSADTNLMNISAKCRRLRAEHRRLGLIVVDYLQLMAPESGEKRRFDNRTQEISALSRGLKLLANSLKVPVIALSQLSRAPETRPGDHRPQLSDLRDSGSIEQDADVVGFIFREEVYKPDREDLRGVAELLVAKQRNGPTGRIKLAFLNKYVKFENLADDIGDLDEEVGGEESTPPF